MTQTVSESIESTQAGARAALASGFRVVSLCTLLSRILGLVRDMALAALFGAGPILDAFTVAFRIPNLARQLFGEGALTSAFLPIFVREMQAGDARASRRMATAVFVTLAAALLTIVAIAELLLAAVLISTNLSSDARLLLELLAILTPYLLFICLAALGSAVLHSLRHFTWPALLPVVLNLIWLAGTGLAPWLFTEPVHRIRFISACLVAAGVAQLGIAVGVLSRRGFTFAPDWKRAAPRVREVFLAMLPVVLGFSVGQFNTMFDSLIAWAAGNTPLGEMLPVPIDSGTASALYFGQRMYQFPLGVFGVALGTVLFPLLASHAQAGDQAALRGDLSYGVRLTIAIGIPASVGLVVLSGPITALLFQHGQFDADDARLTSRMVAIYGASVWAYIALLIINRGFYAVGDRMTPVRVGLAIVPLNLVLNLVLLWIAGGAGLAIGTATAAGIQALLALGLLQVRTGRLTWSAICRTLWLALLCTALMTGACLIVQWLLPRGETLPLRALAVLAPLAAGLAAYLAGAALLKLSEPWDLLRREGGSPSGAVLR
jgi:putative peptidoglycan lipid II flippase